MNLAVNSENVDLNPINRMRGPVGILATLTAIGHAY